MKTQELNQERPDCQDSFTAVIVYEDTRALQRALPTFQRLIQEFGADTEFKCIWASFENLTNPTVARDAARHARRADIVIFSIHSTELPASVRQWIEEWLPHKDLNDSALVALLECAHASAGAIPAQRYLKNAAARASMNFLSENKVPPLPAFIPTIVPNNRFIAPNHWGINE